ncbi:uncharacterized protein NEPG_02105, partial [Nematocida parisii ERTm1]
IPLQPDITRIFGPISGHFPHFSYPCSRVFRQVIFAKGLFKEGQECIVCEEGRNKWREELVRVCAYNIQTCVGGCKYVIINYEFGWCG